MRTNDGRHGTLGFLWVVYGVICIIKAAGIVVYWDTLTLMWGALLNRVANPFFWMSAFHSCLWGAVVLLIVTAIFSFLGAVALMQRGRSNHMLALVAGFLGLITGPLGIALGVYTLIIVVPQSLGQARGDLG